MGLDMYMTISRKLSHKRKSEREVVKLLDSCAGKLTADSDGELYVGQYTTDDDAKKLGALLRSTKIGADVNTICKVDGIWHLNKELMYWRKANQIHQWFVDNVQNGVDDCGRYVVDLCQIDELLYDIDLVLSNHSLADDILPTQNGFFFGGTEYDKYYFSDLRETKRNLKPLRKRKAYRDETRYEFRYSSSW
jgi:hypothetical protein